jgi:hypothetical protein
MKMAIGPHQGKKSPSQNPDKFFKNTAKGGPYGTPGAVPDRLSGGPMREKMGGKGKKK